MKKTKITRPNLLTVLPDARSAWSKHVLDWATCQRCPLGERACRHVLARGTLPADVLIVGEAPGTAEDVIGFPFVGPSGDLLNSLLAKTLDPDQITYAITNVVACIPHEDTETTVGGVRPPAKPEAKACRPRLLDLLKIANVKAIVYVGKVAVAYRLPESTAGLFGPLKRKSSSTHLDDDRPLKREQVYMVRDVPHPSYCLRLGGVQKQIEEKRIELALIEIRDFILALRG